MEIFFCEKCGNRVTDFEVGRGEAVQVGPDEVYCKGCAPEGATSSPKPRAAQSRPAPRGARPATRNIRRPTTQASAGAKRSFTVPIVIAMSVIMGVAAAVILASGRNDEAGSQAATPAAVPAPPAPPAPPTAPAAPTAPTAPTPPAPSPPPAGPAGGPSVKDGLAFWVEAGRWISVEPDGTVKSWNSMAPGSAGLYQRKVDLRPRRVAGPTGGSFAVRFDGKDDRMSRGLKEKLIGDSTVVIAFKLNELGQGSRCAVFASSLQTGPATFQITVDGKNPGTVGIVSRLERRMPIAAATTDFTIIVVRRRGSELVGRSGGKLTATLVLKAKEMEKVSHVILGTNRAKNSWLSCDIAEVLVYGRALSDAEIVSVEDYLSKKYAIPLTGR